MEASKALSQFCEKVTHTASSFAKAAGEQYSKASAYLSQVAAKVSAYAKPHLENAKTFMRTNQVPIIVGAICMGIGVAIATALTSLWRAENDSVPIDPSRAIPVPA